MVPTMDALTAEEASLLEQLRQANRARLGIAPVECKPISHPEKYAYPIGIDSAGQLFPVRLPAPKGEAK